MSKDSTTPKAGGLLDLSTGKPAPPPAPKKPVPAMPEDADPAIAAGKTLNLSKKTGGGGGRNRRKHAQLANTALVRETVDLSSATSKPPAEPPKAQAAQPTSGGRKGSKTKDGRPKGDPRKGGRPTGGGKRDNRRDGGPSSRGKAPAAAQSSLADLLDPDVLAKLRGG